MQVLPLADEDRPWVPELCRRRFGSETVALLGRLHHPALFPGLVAWEAGERVGALSVFTDESGAEVVLLAADRPGWGADGALLRSLAELGHRGGWEGLWLVATNDNTPALRFYQCRDWDPVALHTGAVGRDRLLEPGIPLQGVDGIPVRHLLELRRTVGSGRGMP